MIASVSKGFPVADPGFPPGGGVRQPPNWDYFANFFAENCMKMKEFGPRGVAGLWSPLDLPMFPSKEETVILR